MGSIALRGWRGTLARVRDTYNPSPSHDNALPLMALDDAGESFALPPCVEPPRVSIIIPVYGNVQYTIACLRSIARHAPSVPFEIIVVDDASMDDTAKIVSEIGGVCLLQNAINLGFIGSCNAGAAVATGEFLYFLNNDTQVTPGWLDALLACFTEEPQCGIAGSQLVYPDGRLQEAGGTVYADGSCWNIGRFESRANPAYRFRRTCDYVSGASLLISRELFERVEGFDMRFAPAYYEDTDLAFAVRQHGYAVFYEPASVIIHFEGISAGNDLSAGMKRHQVLNRKVFVDKWRDALSEQPAHGESLIETKRRRYRGHILVADVSMPNPSRDSGSLRLCEMLRLLHEDGYQLSFYPDDGYATDESIRLLGALGVESLCSPWVTHLPDWLKKNGKYLDAAILCRHVVAGQYGQLVRKYAPNAKYLFDTVDLHFLREERAAELTGHATMERQARASRQSELDLVRQSDITFVVSNHEQALLKSLASDANVALLSNIHRVHERLAPYVGRENLVFIGGHAHPPNADAMRWLASEIVPILRSTYPDVVVHVLGDVPDTIRAKLTSPGLQFHGRVEDLSPWLNGALASIAPLRFGAGVKGKINMSMSYGLPVIATHLAVEGMYLEDGKTVLIAETPHEFAAAVSLLAGNESTWSEMSHLSLENIKQHFSLDLARNTLRHALKR